MAENHGEFVGEADSCADMRHRILILIPMTSDYKDSLPWSHRLNPVARVLVTITAGAAVGLIGTLAHRMGASANIPYGLVLAFVILGLSTWCARSRCGVSGVAWHLIASSGMAWWIAAGAANDGDALIVAGFKVDMPYFGQHAGYIWLYGIVLVQIAFLLMPPRWFSMAPRKAAPDRSASAAGAESADPAKPKIPAEKADAPETSTQDPEQAPQAEDAGDVAGAPQSARGRNIDRAHDQEAR